MSFGLGTPKTTATPAFGTTSTPIFQPSSTQGFNFSSGDAAKPFDFGGGAKPFSFTTPAASTTGSSAFNLSATSPNFSFATPKTTTSSLFGGTPSQPALSFGTPPQTQQQQATTQQSTATGFGITSPLQSSSGFSFGQTTSNVPQTFGSTPKSTGPNLSFGASTQIYTAAITVPSTTTSGLSFGTSGGGIAFGGGGQSGLGFGQPLTTGGLAFGATTAVTSTTTISNSQSPAGLSLTKPAAAVSTATSTGFGFMTPSSSFSLVPKTTPAFGLGNMPTTTSAQVAQPTNTSSPLNAFLSSSTQQKSSGAITFPTPTSSVTVSSVPTAVASTPSTVGVSTASSPVSSFQLGVSSAGSGASGFQLGVATSETAATLGGFGLSTTTTASSSLPSSGGSGITGITSLLPSSGAALSSTAQATTSTTTAATTSMPLTTATITTPAQVPQPLVSLNFAQLEENINKWTLDLEEQEKIFINQATQINAWDSLLISNGEKIVELNEAVQAVKGEQESLEHELDFVLAQQKELEELLAPLEKDLANVAVRDPEREHMYQMAENVDTQLKQMSEDLKEIIEHLNESNRNQDSNDPIVQIRRILNAHMSSMQWIDTTTAQISNKLDQVSNMHNTLRCDNQRSFHMAYNIP